MTISLKYILVAIGVLAVVWFFLFREVSPAAPVTTRDISPNGVRIIAFGDSLTAGYGLAPEESYPSQLEAALRAEGVVVNIENAGVSGETTAENRARAQTIRAKNPDIVLLGIGGNDALRRLSLETTRENIEATVSVLQSGANPPVVVLLHMQAPPTAGLAYKQTFDRMYEEIAEEYQLLLVPFLTTELFLRSEYKLSDGIHYNQAGYREVVNRYLLDEVNEIISDMTE